jgi:hypothetical protein
MLFVAIDVAAVPEDGVVVVTAQADGDASGELEAAMEKADLLERAFGVRAVIRQAEDRVAVAADGEAAPA